MNENMALKFKGEKKCRRIKTSGKSGASIGRNARASAWPMQIKENGKMTLSICPIIQLITQIFGFHSNYEKWRDWKEEDGIIKSLLTSVFGSGNRCARAQFFSPFYSF